WLVTSLLYIAVPDRHLPRTLLYSRAVFQRGKENLLQRSCWRLVWVWSWLLCFREDPSRWRSDLWPSRSINCIPHYQNHGATAPTGRRRRDQEGFAPLEEQARVPKFAMAEYGRIQRLDA